MTDLVVLSLEAWDGVWRRNQHLISRLLEMDPALRVLFVEPAADPIHDVRRGKAPSFSYGQRRRPDVSGRLWTMRPMKALPRRLDPRADDRIARAVMRAARRRGMTDPVLWVNDPAAADVMALTAWPTLYDMTDDWAVAPRSERERVRIVTGEKRLLTEAQQVVACSPELARRKTAQRGDGMPPIALIRNGVDTAAYRGEMPRPADLPAGRVALYAGTLHSDRLDVPLSVETARALTGSATLVFVGPDLLGEADRRTLQDAGAVLLGARPHEQIPAYLVNADVLVVPHLVNEFTDSLDPIKLYEYQAAGRPVVSTDVTGFRDSDGNSITVQDAASFPAAVREATQRRVGTSPAPEVADWSDRVTSMAGVIARLTE